MHSYRDIIEGFYQIYKTWDWEGIFWIDEKQLFATWAEISSVVVNVLNIATVQISISTFYWMSYIEKICNIQQQQQD